MSIISFTFSASSCIAFIHIFYLFTKIYLRRFFFSLEVELFFFGNNPIVEFDKFFPINSATVALIKPLKTFVNFRLKLLFRKHGLHSQITQTSNEFQLGQVFILVQVMCWKCFKCWFTSRCICFYFCPQLLFSQLFLSTLMYVNFSS